MIFMLKMYQNFLDLIYEKIFRGGLDMEGLEHVTYGILFYNYFIKLLFLKKS